MLKFESIKNFLNRKIKDILIFYFKIYAILLIKKFQSQSNIFKKKKLNTTRILCESLWINPVHYLRLLLFLNVFRKRENISTFGICLKEISLLNLYIFKIVSKSKIFFVNKFNYSEKTRPFIKKKISFSNKIYKHIYSDIYCKIFNVPSVDFYSNNHNELKKYIDNLIKQFEQIIKKQKVNLAILSHPVGIYMGPLCYALLRNNVKVYILNGVNKHITIRKMNKLQDYLKYFNDSLSNTEFNKISPKKKYLFNKLGAISYKGTFFKNKSDFARLKIFSERKPFFKNKKKFLNFFNFDSNKKVYVIMANCYTDYPNNYKEAWYKDYYNFLKMVLVCAKNSNYNWLLKPHPAEKEFGVTTQELLDSKEISLPKNVKIWKKANNFDRFEYTDGIVTSVGTSALENTCLGKLAICTEETGYSAIGIVKKAKNFNQLKNLILNMRNLKVSKKNIFKAKIIYYFYNEDTFLEMPSQHTSMIGFKEYSNFFKKKNDIKKEMKIISKWLESSSRKYDVYKKLNYI